MYNKKCDEFIEEKCLKIKKPPYFCNGCKYYYSCRLTKYIYNGAFSYNKYIKNFEGTRTGITITEKEIDNLNNALVSFIKEQNQSVHQAIINNKDKIMYGDKTIYKLIDLDLLKVLNIDLLRKFIYRERRKQSNNYYKVDKNLANVEFKLSNWNLSFHLSLENINLHLNL